MKRRIRSDGKIGKQTRREITEGNWRRAFLAPKSHRRNTLMHSPWYLCDRMFARQINVLYDQFIERCTLAFIDAHRTNATAAVMKRIYSERDTQTRSWCAAWKDMRRKSLSSEEAYDLTHNSNPRRRRAKRNVNLTRREYFEYQNSALLLCPSRAEKGEITRFPEIISEVYSKFAELCTSSRLTKTTIIWPNIFNIKVPLTILWSSSRYKVKRDGRNKNIELPEMLFQIRGISRLSAS